jgi:hypothetical protein
MNTNFNLTADANLIKRMNKKGILFRFIDDGSLMDMYECSNEYLFHNDKYVVTLYTCDNVIDPQFLIYDINTLNRVASQWVRPQQPCERFNENQWGSFVEAIDNDDDDDTFKEMLEEDKSHRNQYEIDYERE